MLAALDLYPLALLALGFATANTLVRSALGWGRKRGQVELLLTSSMTVEARNARADRIRVKVLGFLALTAVGTGVYLGLSDVFLEMSK
jgi:hypothetical protein